MRRCDNVGAIPLVYCGHRMTDCVTSVPLVCSESLGDVTGDSVCQRQCPATVAI